MKFRVAREVLADAVAWTARSLPPRPSVPVLAGILLEVDGNQLSVSGFDYEVSARAEVDVHATEGGRVLVPGRLLAEITRALPPHPVEITAEGPRLSIACSNARFSLPTLPVEDYPSLPSMPSSAGLVDSDVFAEAVSQVAVAAGRDDTLPMLTGVRLEIEDDLITLAATDRYRLAVREFAWRPETPGVSAAVLVPARTLADAAKTLTSGPEIVLSLSSGGSGEGILGLSGKDRQTTTRLLDAEFVKYRAIMPSESAAQRRPAGRPVHRRRQARGPGRRARHAAALRVHPRAGDAAGRRHRRRGAGRGALRRRVRRRAADHRLQPDVPARRPGRGAHRAGADGLHQPAQARRALRRRRAGRPTTASRKPAERPGSYRYLIMPVRLPG